MMSACIAYIYNIHIYVSLMCMLYVSLMCMYVSLMFVNVYIHDVSLCAYIQYMCCVCVIVEDSVLGIMVPVGQV